MDAAAAAAVSTLSALAVFVSTVHQGAVRSAHGYRVVGRREWERWVEREFAFSPSACREVPLPVGAPRILPTDWRGRPVYREGQLVGPWRCILAFDSVAGVAPPPTLPPLLSPSGNARLICCVPTLYNDLRKLFPIQKLEKVPELIQCDTDEQKTPLAAQDLISKKVHTEPIQCVSDEQKAPLALDTKDAISNKVQQSGSHSDVQRAPLDTFSIKVQQLGSDSDEQRAPLEAKDMIPIKVQQPGPDSEEQRTPLDTKDTVSIKVQQSGPDSDGPLQSGEELPTPMQKQRRAQREYIASITLGDIAQYFHLPIREASRTLQIGLSILKKKCRQYGIPRWPHRKIKSLDSLIQDLEYVIDDTERDGAEEEDNTQKEKEKEDAIRSLAKRKRMLETEMATIQQKPTLDLMTETKQFRQFVFKRRYKAKHLVDE